MSQWDHERRVGYLAAYRELHRRVAEDLQAKRGEIKPPRILFAYYDSAKVLLKAKVLAWTKKSA